VIPVKRELQSSSPEDMKVLLIREGYSGVEFGEVFEMIKGGFEQVFYR